MNHCQVEREARAAELHPHRMCVDVTTSARVGLSVFPVMNLLNGETLTSVERRTLDMIDSRPQGQVVPV